jgi:hypothetical protein
MQDELWVKADNFGRLDISLKVRISPNIGFNP